MKSKDSTIYYLDSITAGKYMSAVRDREAKKTPVTEFMLADIEKALKADQIDLLKLRESNILDLKHYASEASAKQQDFVSNLSKVTDQLQTAKSKSNELYASTNQVSTEFSKVTEKLDFAASLVQRAEDMRIVIGFIQQFNVRIEVSQNQDDPQSSNASTSASNSLDKLVSKMNLPQSLYQRAELIAKLIKIVASAEGDYLFDAKLNLQDYKEVLKQQLVEEFQKNYKVNKYEQAKCAQALELLQAEYLAIESFIKSTPLMSDPNNKYLYKESYLYQSENILIDHYKETCAFFVTDCKKNWEVMDTIFNQSQQPKTTLVQMIFDGVFKPYITNVLKYYLEIIERKQQEQKNREAQLRASGEKDPRAYEVKQNCNEELKFCEIFFRIHNETNEMLKNVWSLEGQTFNNQIITDNTFKPFQVEYEKYETQVVVISLQNEVKDTIKKLKQIIENAKKWITRKDETKYDILSEFNRELPSDIISIGAAAWERCIALADPSKKHQFLKNLIDIVIQANLREYLLTFLEACKICLQKENDVNIVPQFFNITTIVNSAILTIEGKYTQLLKPTLMQKPNIHEDFIREKDSLIAALEEGVTSNLQICINTIVNRVKSIVSTKNFKSAYLKQNFDMGSASSPCQEICQVLVGPNSIINDLQALTGENYISFCTVLCKELLDTIVEAFFDLRYEFPNGTMAFSMDVNEYRTAFAKFNLDFVNNKFDDLDKAAKLMCTPVDRIQMIKKDLQMQPKAIDLARRLLPLRSDAKEGDLLNAL